MSSKNQRSFKNWLIAPYTKIEYVIYSCIFGGLSIILFQILIIHTLEPADPNFLQKMGFFLGAYFSLCVLFGIWMSHQFIGPMVAFRRHIQELIKGNYGFKTHLRKGDQFAEFMSELNKLSDSLASKNKSQHYSSNDRTA